MKQILIVLLLSSPVLGADIVNEHMTTNTYHRWEILQSTIVAKLTFKVDKWAGNVYQLVRESGEDGSQIWQHIPFGSTKPTSYEKISYQVFTSGIQARFTYLMDVHTGACWLIVADAKGNNSWQYVRTYGTPR